MHRTLLLGALTATLLAPFAIAHAHSDVSVSVSTPNSASGSVRRRTGPRR